jgi:hypothetical protein
MIRSTSRFIWLAFVALTLAAPNFLFSSAEAQNDRLAGQPLSDYKARRARLMEQIKDGIVVLVGAREEDLGEVGRFRQKNDFMYLTGVETPAAFLLLVPAELTKGNSLHSAAQPCERKMDGRADGAGDGSRTTIWLHGSRKRGRFL